MTKPTARRFAWTFWALCPVFALAWLAGPGKGAGAKDRAATAFERALELRADAVTPAEWRAVRAELGAALSELAEGTDEATVAARGRLQLESAKAAVQAGDMWQGIDELETLLATTEERGGDGALEKSARAELATSRYFAAWLLRLEGAPAEEWKPEAQSARQHFRLLAESDVAASPAESDALKKNVEAVVRLEQMDLEELRAMPLPKNCSCNCKGLRESRSQCKGGRCQNPDGRKKSQATGAGAARASGAGS